MTCTEISPLKCEIRKYLNLTDNEGIFIQNWEKFDAEGSNDTMHRSEDMAIDPVSGNVYITDTGDNRIIKLDDKYNFILDWGSLGECRGEFRDWERNMKMTCL